MTEPAIDLGSSRRKKSQQNSGRTTYCTPRYVLDCVLKLGRIAHDPAWHPSSLVRARLTATKDQDGLSYAWPTSGLTWCNPPYGVELDKLWAPRFISEARRGVELITIVPASTETIAYRTQLFACSAAMHFSQRVTFLGEEFPAKFSNALFYFGPRPTAFTEAFRSIAYPISSPLNRPVWRAAA